MIVIRPFKEAMINVFEILCDMIVIVYYTLLISYGEDMTESQSLIIIRF